MSVCSNMDSSLCVWRGGGGGGGKGECVSVRACML